MRNDALFVNNARAGLVEKDALLNDLNQGRPFMTALDVFDKGAPIHMVNQEVWQGS